MKKVLALIMALFTVISLTLFSGCNDNKKVEEFYNLVCESQQALDAVADDIYDNWHGAIYDNDFSGNINIAIYRAQLDNEENLTLIDENDVKIQDLYKEVKDSKYSSEIKDVMHAYSDYYEFVVNVSGSFNTYKAQKEELKKELASSLKNLQFEL